MSLENLLKKLLPPFLALSIYSCQEKIPGKIVFTSDRNRRYSEEIYIMNANGSHQKRLTYTQSRNWSPLCSPDGKKIAFASFRDKNWEIYTMNINGSQQKNLTNTPEISEDNPLWSLDGKKILFSSDMKKIEIINADGSNRKDLTQGHSSRFPSWSPDGKKIAFYAFISKEEKGIYTINPDGSGFKKLTENFDLGPVWSSDGKKIAFTSKRDNNFEIYIMNANGSQQKRLTYDESSKDWFPRWTPDNRIIFESNHDLYLINPDGTQRKNLTPNTSSSWEAWPTFSPDGQWLAFNSDRGKDWLSFLDFFHEFFQEENIVAFGSPHDAIYLMKTNGSELRRLTPIRHHDERPHWCP